MTDIWKPGTVFLRHVDKTGYGYVEQHQAWNTDQFIAGQQNAAAAEGGSISVVTQADYRAAQGYKHG